MHIALFCLTAAIWLHFIPTGSFFRLNSPSAGGWILLIFICFKAVRGLQARQKCAWSAGNGLLSCRSRAGFSVTLTPKTPSSPGTEAAACFPHGCMVLELLFRRCSVPPQSLNSLSKQNGAGEQRSGGYFQVLTPNCHVRSGQVLCPCPLSTQLTVTTSCFCFKAA